MSSGKWTAKLQSIWVPFYFTSLSDCSFLRISGVAIFNIKQKDEVITSLTLNKCNPHVCCLWGIKSVMVTDNKNQTLKESSCYFLHFPLILLNRSNDSSLLCGGAVRWRDSHWRMWGKRGACRVCPGQEGHSLFSAGGDGSACPRLLPQFSRTSIWSVREMLLNTSTFMSLYFLSCFETNLKLIFQTFKKSVIAALIYWASIS